MKLRKSIVAMMVSLLLVSSISTLCIAQVCAHNLLLDVSYDACDDDVDSDGIDEMWYAINKSSKCWHLGNNVTTIKYYFEEKSSDGHTWLDYAPSAAIAEEIKNAYASSMEKWNNVYYYSYNADGTLSKNKLINIVEGTAGDHNLSIFPGQTLENDIAVTTPVSESMYTVQEGGVLHKHYSQWSMTVYVDRFYVHNNQPEEKVSVIRERTGAHEIGHVLGLRDIDNDNLCGANSNEDHHYEILMGYGDTFIDRSKDITYRDIAGVAITRGFHTDNDHKWLNAGLQSNGQYKLICSICNGIKYVNNLSGYTYDIYNACEGEHDLSDGNMMAVACYETSDYYKCKYCRYVASFSDRIPQNYSIGTYSPSFHKRINSVDGLEYTLLEKHSYTYMWRSEAQHKAICGACNQIIFEAHAVAQGSFPTPDGYATCLKCRGKAFVGELLNKSMGDLVSNSVGVQSCTPNGSYILPNGVIVLVDDDVEAYMNGTLVFSSGLNEQ